MKVESVESYPIRVKMKEKLRGGTFTYSDYQTVLVKASCDGQVGWGEAMSRFDPKITAEMVNYLAKDVIGTGIDKVSETWKKIWRSLRVRGHSRGVAVEALSGIEISLYDCWGMLTNKSIVRLFNRRPLPRVRVFAGSFFESRGPLRPQVERAKASELLGAKVKVGFGVQKDLELLKKVRKDWPEGMIVADANGAYDAATAAAACKAFEGLELAWFEEPVLSNDWEGYSRLKGSKVKIGAGESWFADDFKEPLDDRLVSVVEPSVSRCGGIETEMKVARMAGNRNIAFSPMVGMNSGISLAASIHVASAYQSAGVEFNPFPNPLQNDLVQGIPEPRGGLVGVPRGPGLGISVDEGFIKKHSV